MTVTGKSITDAQIRELLEASPPSHRWTRIVCKVALDEGAVHRTVKQINDARERCAKLYNERFNADASR